jgi:hypothetical protein
VDTAVRMNVLDAMRRLNQRVRMEVGEAFGANGVEIDAHMLCAEDHLPYQGGQYSNEEFQQIQDGLQRPFGEWNCRHSWFPIIMGITPPTYTQEELDDFKTVSREEITIDGRTKSRYEWTQEQRRIETAIRYQKDIAIMAKASGDMVARRECAAMIRELEKQYSKITEAAGLDERRDKMRVSGFYAVKPADALKNPFSALKNERKNGILVVTETRTGHATSKPKEGANAVIDVVGKKGGISRFIYNGAGRVQYRVDNNDHGYPSEHPFINGEHYHIAEWNGNAFAGYVKGKDIPDTLRSMCADILKGGN